MKIIYIIIFSFFLFNCSININNWVEYDENIKILLFSDKNIIEINEEVTFFFIVKNNGNEMVSLQELNVNSLIFYDTNGNHLALGANQAKINNIVWLQPGDSLIYSFKYIFNQDKIYDTYILYFYPTVVDIPPSIEKNSSYYYKSNILRIQVIK